MPLTEDSREFVEWLSLSKPKRGLHSDAVVTPSGPSRT
jgi:hypothetical protein